MCNTDIVDGTLVDRTTADGTARVIGHRRALAAFPSDDPMILRQATRDAYQSLRKQFEDQGDDPLVPVRFWNFIPRLLAPAGKQLNQYMAFNLGRQDILGPWLTARRATRGVAATGVGHSCGASLDVYVLALREAGQAVENPRQIPAWKYSSRFGPGPPLFTRAIWIRNAAFGKGHRLLMSGTASVVGEESFHAGDLERQLDETVRNIEHLLSAAGRDPTIESLRIYVTSETMITPVRERVLQEFPSVTSVEFFVTDLCRPDLLVEIEGFAVAGCDDSESQDAQ